MRLNVQMTKGEHLARTWCNRLLSISVVLITVLATYFLSLSRFYSFPDGEAYDDLLLNYAGGFVRRGLLGELAFQLRAAFGIDPLHFFTLLLGMGHAFVSYSLLRLLLRRVDDSLLWFSASLSPATLLFTFHEASAFARKDILSIVLIAAHSMFRRPSQKSDLLLAGSLALSVLVHEVQAFFLGFHALLIMSRGKKGRLAILLPAICTLLFSVFNIGDISSQAAICDSLNGRNCSAFSAQTIREAIDSGIDTALAAGQFYFVAGPLALLPAMLLRRYRKLRHAPSDSSLAISCLIALPLFVLAADWGRWFHLMVMHLVFVMIVSRSRYHKVCKAAPVFLSIECFGLCYLYVLGWRLLQGRPGFFLGRVYEVVSVSGMSSDAYSNFSVALLPAIALVFGLYLRRKLHAYQP